MKTLTFLNKALRTSTHLWQPHFGEPPQWPQPEPPEGSEFQLYYNVYKYLQHEMATNPSIKHQLPAGFKLDSRTINPWISEVLLQPKVSIPGTDIRV